MVWMAVSSPGVAVGWYDDCYEPNHLHPTRPHRVSTEFIPLSRKSFITMSQSYDSSLSDRPGILSLPANYLEQARAFAYRLTASHPVGSAELQLSRSVCLLMVVLLLTFGAVYKLTDMGGHNAFWPEMSLAFAALLTLASSYRFSFIRRHFDAALRVLCYLVAGWFILLASYNAFLPNFAVGLLFIIPGLGVGYSVTLRKVERLVIFFAVTVTAASIACAIFGGSSIAAPLFIASLICISLVTLFVAAGRLDAQKQFHAIEQRYHAVVEQASDGIYLLDAESLRFLDANPAFCRMAGRTIDQLKRKVVTDFVVAPPDAASDEGVHAFRGRHAHVTEGILRREDGTMSHVELHIDRIHYADREVLSVVVHDISSRKEYEERLVKAKENAEEISSFKTSLLANMSHEIRTPLSSILGWTTVLNDEVPANQRELIKLIEQSGRRLHNTLDSVLELAQLDANTKKLHPILVDVSEEVRSVACLARSQAESKGIAFSLDVQEEPAWTQLDVSCLRRVLNHVIDNAIKFTDSGSVSLKVGTAESVVHIEIVDTGVGISEEFLPSIFEEFKQESAGLDRDHEGNGLGLAITRRLVDLLGGTIDVQSRRGKGTTFSIAFPATSKSDRHANVA